MPNNHILLIEDNDDTAWSIATLLKPYGWTVDIAHTIQQLKEDPTQHTRQPYAAILLDLNLPDSKNTNTLDTVKTIYPTIPIIIITGQSDLEPLITNKNANDILLKVSADADLINKSLQKATEINQVTNGYQQIKEEIKKVLTITEELQTKIEHTKYKQYHKR